MTTPLSPRFISSSAGETFGRVLHARRAGRFLFRESRYGSTLHMPEHYHPCPYFSLVTGGHVRERAAGAEYEYEPGTLHFHPAGDPHTVWMGAEGARCLSIVLCGELPDGFAVITAAARQDAPWSPAAQLARRCQRELRATDTASDLALEALALEMLALCLRGHATTRRGDPRWLFAVRDHLHARFLERVPLSELSAVAGIHEVHLVRAFRRRFGATPGAYVRALRVEHARRALVDSEAPIAGLALAAGFSSQSHFTRVFHRLTGSTPAAYRRARSRRA